MSNSSDGLDRRSFLGLAATIGVATAGYGMAESTRSWPEQVSFSFAVIADPHCAEGPRQGMELLGSAVDRLLRCFQAMEELPPDKKPDFVLIAGDIHPEALAPHLDEIHIPIHAVAGNHEGSKKSRGLLRSLFPDDFGVGDNVHDYYSFEHKGVKFIGLCDAGAGGDHVGQFSSELIKPAGQCDWFEEELGMSGKRKVVFAHIPPALDGGDHNMHMGRNDSRWFVKTVKSTPPEMLFFGHLHHATEAYSIGEAQAFNLRSCCWNFQNTPVGFMLVQVTQEGMETQEIITGKVHVQ
ncbi:MAG: metallophosphoesterase [Candidatus Hydrogenedentes bacterium]|nr:metallophosphoesterase [Candidatus Hydrogenedentota bacterium]